MCGCALVCAVRVGRNGWKGMERDGSVERKSAGERERERGSLLEFHYCKLKVRPDVYTTLRNGCVIAMVALKASLIFCSFGTCGRAEERNWEICGFRHQTCVCVCEQRNNNIKNRICKVFIIQ